MSNTVRLNILDWCQVVVDPELDSGPYKPTKLQEFGWPDGQNNYMVLEVDISTGKGKLIRPDEKKESEFLIPKAIEVLKVSLPFSSTSWKFYPTIDEDGDIIITGRLKSYSIPETLADLEIGNDALSELNQNSDIQILFTTDFRKEPV